MFKFECFATILNNINSMCVEHYSPFQKLHMKIQKVFFLSRSDYDSSLNVLINCLVVRIKTMK